MDHYERSKLADAIRESKYSAGDQIIKQGDDGNVFYIISEGEAVATKSINGEEKEVMNYK
jgi:cAMP-dependent protein kinase regulator